MQQAMQRQNPQFFRGRMAFPARLPGRQTGRNRQVTKDLGARRPPGFGRWKRQNVGGSVDAPIPVVEAAHRLIAHQRDANHAAGAGRGMSLEPGAKTTGGLGPAPRIGDGDAKRPLEPADVRSVWNRFRKP
jgi:hypothetical protein